MNEMMPYYGAKIAAFIAAINLLSQNLWCRKLATILCENPLFNTEYTEYPSKVGCVKVIGRYAVRHN